MAHSRVALRLLRLFALGILAATEVQLLAMDAWAETARKDDPLLKKLAKVGSSGKYSGNMQRDVLKAAEMAGIVAGEAPAYFFALPGPGGKMTQGCIYLPHEHYHNLVTVDV